MIQLQMKSQRQFVDMSVDKLSVAEVPDTSNYSHRLKLYTHLII